MKMTNEESVNNGTYAWNKLDTDITDSYSPPIVENSDVLDLQRNRVRSKFTTHVSFLDITNANVYILNFLCTGI